MTEAAEQIETPAEPAEEVIEEPIAEEPEEEPQPAADEEKSDPPEIDPMGKVQESIDALGDKFGKMTRHVQTMTQRVDDMRRGAEEPPAPADDPADKPVESDFESYEDFTEALTDWKVDKKLTEYRKEDADKGQADADRVAEDEFRGKMDDGFERYSDFDEVAFDPTLPVTPAMAGILRECDNPADVAYYLGKNSEETASISNMTPAKAAIALGKIDAIVGKEIEAGGIPKAAKQKRKKVSKAPKPIKPLAGAEVITKDPDKMTQAEYEAWRQGA